MALGGQSAAFPICGLRVYGGMRFDRDTALFVLLCLIWGTTWLAMKVGIATTPALLFAATRFITAGLVLCAVLAVRRRPLLPKTADLPRMMAVTALMLTACYGLLFWGSQFISSGLAGVLEMSLTPVSLLGFALLFGDERFDARRAGAIALGVVGLVVLFIPTVRMGGDGKALAGAVAVCAASILYSWGAVLSRRLMRTYSSLHVAAFTMTVGGAMLLAVYFAVTPDAVQMALTPWRPAAIAGWLFMVLAGSLAGYTIYMHLLRVWGSSRSGAYAFPSSAVAVVVGCVALGEKVTALGLAGMAILLAAAWFAIKPQSARSPEPESEPEPAS